MISKPPFIALLAGILLVPWIEWVIVTPVVFYECWQCTSDDVSVNKRLRKDCAASGEGDTLQSIAALAPGHYMLTMVATSGPKAGKETTGPLWLHPTSPSDSSPFTGHKPLDTNPREVPLFGTADLDWNAVDAPVFPSDTLAPNPTSRDPVRPGVLVLIENWEHPSLRKRPLLLIGTLTNRRDDEGWQDGPGVQLVVRTQRGQGFRGTWGNWGIVRGGSGYFCTAYDGP